MSEFSAAAGPSPDFFFYLARSQVIVFRLPNGGDHFPDTVTPVDAGVLPTLRRCAEFLPVVNDAIATVAVTCFEHKPDATFVLLNDTASYSDLALPAKVLGLPYHLFREGIRRYGADGVCFEWIRRMALESGFLLRRWIGIHIDEESTVSAFHDRKPVDTSAGLSPLDGIPGLVSCGTLDPAIPLLMSRSANADDHLAFGSGLSSVVGRPVSLADILDGADPETAAARDVLEFHLAHHLGAMMAALGGADTIVFAAGRLEAALPVVYSLCRRLAFCRVHCRPLVAGPIMRISDLTAPESEVTVLAVDYDPWLAMRDLANSALENRGNSGR